MGRKWKAPIPFDAIGANLAQLMDVKRRLIEHGIEYDDVESVYEILDGMRFFLRCLLEELEAGLRDGSLEDMTPERAQQAIYGIRIFEGTLQENYPESKH